MNDIVNFSLIVCQVLKMAQQHLAKWALFNMTFGHAKINALPKVGIQ
jgi:hypothetical protein